MLILVCDSTGSDSWSPLVDDHVKPEAVRRMDTWWQEEMSAMDSQAMQSYYRLLEHCEWMVWRVRAGKSARRHLRVMQWVGGGDARICLALHFAVVNDESVVGRR